MVRKTDLDIQREDKAHEINGTLIGTGLEVIASRKRGPYQLIIKDLSEKEVQRIIKIMKASPATSSPDTSTP